MSLDKGTLTGHPLGRVSIFGNPFHGTVQGGTLTLPNGATRAHPQPDATELDAAGTAHLVKVPGMAEVSRTTEQLEADEAAGREWRNTALLSGSKFQLYGVNIDGWIYVDSAGDRWLVNFTVDPASVTYAFNNPALSFELRFRRFGVFGQEASWITRTAAITNYGQSFDNFDGFLNSTDPIAYESVGAGSLFVDAVLPDGSKAALMIFRKKFYLPDQVPEDPTVDVLYRHPLGWLQLEITGLGSSPTVTLSVMKSRAQSIELMERTFDTSAVTEEPVDATDDHPGYLSARSGLLVWKFQYRKYIAARPNEDGDGFVFDSLLWVGEGDNSGSYSFTGNVLNIVRLNNLSDCYILEADGEEVARMELELTTSYGVSIEHLTEEDDPWAVVSETARTRNLTFNGTPYNETVPAPPDFDVPSPLPSFDAIDSSGSVLASPLALSFQELIPIRQCYIMGWRYDYRNTVGEFPGGRTVAIDLVRYSGRVLGFRHQMEGDFVYHERHTPIGRVGDLITRDYDPEERMYASWCPATGAMTGLEETPICWV